MKGNILRCGITGSGRLDREEQEIVRVEAQADVVEVHEGADEETGSDDEQHGEGYLNDDDGLAGEALASTCGGRGGVFERGVDLCAGSLPRGGEAEEDAGEERDCGSEGEDAKVESGR